MFLEERHKLVLDTLATRLRMTTQDLQKLLKASPATVRRDIQMLEDQGRIVRVHGGIMHPKYMQPEHTFDEKTQEAVEGKAAIAAIACDLVPQSATVFVDSGTTCLEIGRRLLLRKDVTIVTNSIPVASLGGTEASRLICIGGEVREVSRALTGALSLNWLGHLRFDVAIIGASGLSAREGASTTELTEAALKQELVKRSGIRILAATSDKWERPNKVVFARWEDFQHWVTDRRPARGAAQGIADRGIKIHAAGQKS